MNNVTHQEVAQVEIMAANIGYLIELRGWSWNRLAIEAGIPQPTVSRLKNAKFDPAFFTIRRIATTLNTSMEWLCENHEEKVLTAAG